ncbi:Vesicular acetylcholine transporter unc-17 [Trichostrongylus colubriformis]|uniref:Vesicular acetylcholine transporter unc-17 n=1 Tax=Trichostrongylus colubriformis TaxID=6319 RepID=A0AAN8G767_TRICO
MAKVSLAFLESTITKWMAESMPNTPVWLVGVIWLPSFFPHVLVVYITVKILKAFPDHTWEIASFGLDQRYFVLCRALHVFSISADHSIELVCFGIALIDTSLLPTLRFLVDTRYVPLYDSMYAIADISYSLAYAFGPIIAAWIMGNMSFLALNIIIFVFNIVYTPVIFMVMLKKVHEYDSVTPKQEMTSSKNDNYGKIEKDGNAMETTSAVQAGYMGPVTVLKRPISKIVFRKLNSRLVLIG